MSLAQTGLLVVLPYELTVQLSALLRHWLSGSTASHGAHNAVSARPASRRLEAKEDLGRDSWLRRQAWRLGSHRQEPLLF